jgi:hypothetical protein
MALIYLAAIIFLLYSEWQKRKKLNEAFQLCIKDHDKLIDELFYIRSRDSYYEKIVEIAKKHKNVFNEKWIRGVKHENGGITITNVKDCYESIVEHIVDADGV